MRPIARKRSVQWPVFTRIFCCFCAQNTHLKWCRVFKNTQYLRRVWNEAVMALCTTPAFACGNWENPHKFFTQPRSQPGTSRLRSTRSAKTISRCSISLINLRFNWAKAFPVNLYQCLALYMYLPVVIQAVYTGPGFNHRPFSFDFLKFRRQQQNETAYIYSVLG